MSREVPALFGIGELRILDMDFDGQGMRYEVWVQDFY